MFPAASIVPFLDVASREESVDNTQGKALTSPGAARDVGVPGGGVRASRRAVAQVKAARRVGIVGCTGS